MEAGSYDFKSFRDKNKEISRLKLQANILEKNEINFLKLSGLTPNKSILDLGCGLGETVSLLNRNFEDLNITGIDSNPVFIEQCRTHSSSNIRFIQSDVNDLSKITDKFDFVYARFLFQHLVEPIKVLKEAYKVLKSNGIMIVLDVDDGFNKFVPSSSSLNSFLEIAEKAQIKNGGDRRVGHKLKEYFASSNFQNIVEVKQKISSQEIGLKNFLDITTGLKMEHIKEDQKVLAENYLEEAYREAFNNKTEGELNLFGVKGQKLN